MIRAVFFDLDDTLCRTSVSREERARRAHKRLVAEGHDVNWDRFFYSVNALDEDGFYRRGMAPVMRDLGLEGTPLGRECVDLWFFKGAEDLVSVFDDCGGVLEELKQRFRLGVITNGPEAVQRNKFDHTGLQPHFELFLTSGAVGIEKPDPGIFRHALKAMDVAPQEAVFIGDHLDLDVIGAQRAGMRGVWFNPDGEPSRHQHIQPDATLRQYCDLPALLDKWAT